MKALSAADVVRAWEAGRGRHAVDRGLLLLALAQPELERDALADLTVGQRNGRLLRLREATLGPALTGLARCSVCGESLEFQFTAAAIRQPEPEAAAFDFQSDGYCLRARLPTSRDLAALAEYGREEDGRGLLLERCALDATLDGAAVDLRALPAGTVAALAEAMSERDPAAETRFLLSCFNCGEQFSVLFDIVTYFWTELEAYAKRLLREVDALARAYAWREADILALSSARRKHYLDLVGG